MHDIIQDKDMNWNDYQERVEILTSVKRAEMQVLMRMGSNLIEIQQASQEIRDILEGALQELE